jgi:catechol 2,3-dioxygenase-like lactoylglutathione lyase family enzyme
MKRFHVHVAVENLFESVKFYSALFGANPAVERPDYAKWMLDDPRVNFAISARGHKPGVNHLGFQAENAEELAELGERADCAAGSAALKQDEAACCYAKSDKYWIVDPQGLAWENFHTLGEVPTFGEDSTAIQPDGTSACCVPLHRSADEPSEGECCVANAAAARTSQSGKAGACC